jgi:hypothetical protein
MYYNKPIKLITILIASIVILIAILSDVGIIKDFALLPICIIGLGVQSILHAYNSYKMDRNRVEVAALSIIGIFVIVSTIARLLINLKLRL